MNCDKILVILHCVNKGDCLSVVAETGAMLMVGFNRRYDPDFAALHCAIANGRVGAVSLFRPFARSQGENCVAVQHGVDRPDGARGDHRAR